MPGSRPRWSSSGSSPRAQQPDRRDAGPRGISRAGLGVEGRIGRRNRQQLKRLGASCDWSRERFTLDEGLSRAVAKVFVQLYRDGLDLQGQAPGQLGPEVPDGDLRSRGPAGRVQGVVQVVARRRRAAERGGARPRSWPRIRTAISITSSIRSSTSAARRPASVYGRDHAARDDARRHRGRGPSRRRALSALVGTKVRLPLVGRLIAIVADEYSDPGEGDGRGQDHARARLQRFRGRQAPRGRGRAADQRAGRARRASS